MKIEPFLLERLQSTHEHFVDINLSESGVEPLTVRELLDDDAEACASILDRPLMYTQTNGTAGLRQAIAGMYHHAGEDHVQVTNGGSEANLVVCLNLIEAGDEVVLMLPNYMQTWGLVRALGATIRPWNMQLNAATNSWQLDVEELKDLVSPRTRLIMICNPNNPTGACLPVETLDEICRVAAGCNAWVHADEIYRGAEIDSAEETPSVWGRYEKTIVTSGLSKAYGLPGLRIGWIVGPPDRIESCWSYHDYTTITVSALSDFLATHALQEVRRQSLLQRTRQIVRTNLAAVRPLLDIDDGLFSYAVPQAGAMLYLKYQPSRNSTEVADCLRQRHSVLVVPGDHYGMDGFLRIGFGGHTAPLQDGLRKLRQVLLS